jgi:hypothetical protein
VCLLAATPARAQPKTFIARLQEINVEEAQHWALFLDQDRKNEAELIERPVYYWTNPTKGGGQHGAVFIWKHEGRPVAVGSIFAHPTPDGRRVVHEFHALSANILYPECRDDDPNTWQPKAGLALQPFPKAEPPDASPSKRLLQMKQLAGQFGGHTVDWRKERWELRLLPRPLYRYEKPKGDVVDGALMALVTDAGTDPEILVLLEATKEGWRYALARFTDSSHTVALGGKEVMSCLRGTPEFHQSYNPDHTYRAMMKRTLTPDDLQGLTEEAQP